MREDSDCHQCYGDDQQKDRQVMGIDRGDNHETNDVVDNDEWVSTNPCNRSGALSPRSASSPRAKAVSVNVDTPNRTPRSCQR